MKLPPHTIITIVLGVFAYAAIVYAVDRSLSGAWRVGYRCVATALTIGLYFLVLQRYVHPDFRVDVIKAVVALAAAGCVVYEAHRATHGRPVAERWKRVVGITLAAAAIVCYFNAFQFDRPRYWHRWDQFHYYMGAKYFRELRYDGLYRCTAIAEDQLGLVEGKDDASGRTVRLDLSKEVRQPGRKIRNLGGDNLLMPVADALEHPERCTSRFTLERWTAFKADVKFFRIVSDEPRWYWEGMQQDHGFNPPPGWMILGSVLANLHPAHVRYMQFLASLDILYLAGTFALIWWAFGWRVFAVAAVFWGCQASAPAYWTIGGFLRQDWFFFLVASACLARKRYFTLAGASIVYASLLRIFPGLILVGWLVVAGAHLMRHKRLAASQRQALIGGVLAATVLVPLSLTVAGADSYRQFYDHTLVAHNRTPGANQMGLRALVSHNLGSTAESGRLKYTLDRTLTDPLEVWLRIRNERYEKNMGAVYAIVALSLAFFIYTARRLRSLWLAGCLAQVFIILVPHLPNYYYSFLVLSALFTGARRRLEAPLFGVAALSQFVFWTFAWDDDRYAALTLISLVLCYGLIGAFLPKGVRRRVSGVFRRSRDLHVDDRAARF
jgi:hypothetical protein